MTVDADDSELVQRCQGGDERAMRELYVRHASRTYAIALRLCGSPGDAEDVVQEAFLRAWRHLPRFRGEASFGTWLCQIAINLCRTLNRKRRPSGPPNAESTVLPQTGDILARQQLEAALAQLPQGYREVVVLHDVLDKNHAEIATLLSISVGTSKSQLHKGRAQLRRLLMEPSAQASNGG